MPTLGLKQIKKWLNAQFAGETRRIVFWYDEKKRYIGDIDNLGLSGVKIHLLTQNNQFKTKYILEQQDTESDYLIYAPFAKPVADENALEDIYQYSRRVPDNSTAYVLDELNIGEEHKAIVEKYIDLFGEKGVLQQIVKFGIDNYTEEIIETSLLSALCEAASPTFEEILRKVLTSGGFEDSPFLVEFEKFNLLNAFWTLCGESFGYTDNNPSLAKLTAALFVNYTARQLQGDIPKVWESYKLTKSGSAVTFLDSMSNSIIYKKHYDELSESIAFMLNAATAFRKAGIERILECDAFKIIDEYIINWIIERLSDEDTGASAGGLDIPGICDLRRKKHFGGQYAPQYGALSAAFEIIRRAGYSCPDGYNDILKQYIKEDYRIDRFYRDFYVSYDCLTDTEAFEKIRESVENIYTNRYFGRLLPAYSAAIDLKTVMRNEQSQLRFFEQRIKTSKVKTAVIISDALRYDVGWELFEKLSNDENCETEIDYMIGVLPAYTRLGWAALLPHKSIEIKMDGKVDVDGKASDDTEKRGVILQAALPNSRCINADSLKNKKPNELRGIFNGMDAVYIRHDVIDDSGSSERDVFTACAEAVDEIYKLIDKLSNNGNVYRFIVTSDHGFLYKRESFTASEKINLDGLKDSYTNRRFVISNQAVSAEGVSYAPLSDIIGGEDKRIVSWPTGAVVFKTKGGLNYVHGGASPQEMILPLITVKTERYHVATHSAQIALVSVVNKITNLITHLEFIQREPVSDVVKSAEYKIYFETDNHEKISDEQSYMADSTETDPSKRVFRRKFNFKNKKYDRSDAYWLVIKMAKDGGDIFKHQVIMDIAFADDFDFGL